MNRKRLLLVIIMILLLIGSAFSFFCYKNYQVTLREQKKEEKEKQLLKEIKNHYNNVVRLENDSTLYRLTDKKYIAVGTIAKDKIVELEDVQDINVNTKYFLVKTLGLYVNYKDVVPSENIVESSDQRFRNYLSFNENIITNDMVTLYDKEKTVGFKLNYSIDVPIIVKDDEGVYVEYFGDLYFINNQDIVKKYERDNSSLEEANSVPVTCYHFIYLPGDNTCNEIICHSQEQIESHFKYLTDNNYFTLNTTELRLFIEGKIRLPKNSILVTIDDGARAEKFIPLLEKYKINATLFLVSSWYPKEKFLSSYMEIASHTNDLHNGGVCPGGQGGAIKCLAHDKLLEDFRKSRETLNGTEAFCYPFYEYNNYTISVLKEAGFKMAFAGGQKKASKGIDLFQIPRITIHNSTSINEYINYVS